MSDNTAFEKSMDDAALRTVLEMADRVKAACMIVEADAKRDCPADLGILRASITHEVEMTSAGITGRIGSTEEYAPYVHQGTGIYAVDGNGRKTPWGYSVKAGRYKGFHWTKGQKPQPFLKNAVIKNKAGIERRLGG